MKKYIALLMCVLMALCCAACAVVPEAVSEAAENAVENAAEAAEQVNEVVENQIDAMRKEPLPASEPDPESQFGVDKNINVGTIDQWLGRDDVAYRDVRMMIDPGCYEAICGDSVLSGTVAGFEVVPYPYLATLHGLPPEVAKTQYDGDKLFDVEWAEDGTIASVTANFAESEAVIHDLFPMDKPIFLMCGGGGYAAFTKALLVALGYDASLIYNIGGYWGYEGENKLEIATTVDGVEYRAFHRLNYHLIDFSEMHAK